jgi:Arc/MetJ-type ribon-helix-helix transcriptional regulator
MNTRIGIRITQKMREEMDTEVKVGHYENISEIVTVAIRQLLKKSNKEGGNP